MAVPKQSKKTATKKKTAAKRKETSVASSRTVVKKKSAVSGPTTRKSPGKTKKSPVKKTAGKKIGTRKTATKKTAAKKTAAKKTAVKKMVQPKTATIGKRSDSKKEPTKKTALKQTGAKKKQIPASISKTLPKTKASPPALEKSTQKRRRSMPTSKPQRTASAATSRKKSAGKEHTAAQEMKKVLNESSKNATMQSTGAVQQGMETMSPTSPPSPVPFEEKKPIPMPTELPDGYGDNLIHLMVRDPFWIYAYWEIHPDHQQHVLARLGGSWDEVSSILRVYDTSDADKTFHFDITLSGMARTWYINTQPNHSYYVEIGLLHRDGRFEVLARSNKVYTPRAGMSDIVDEKWMGIDFDKVYALSGGFEVGKSSQELQKLMKERLEGAVTSGSGIGMLSSMASPVKAPVQRGFWFMLDCELIVYGATEPDAKVTLQGKEMKLRPDGTFSTRFALPDGFYHLDAKAESADGKEVRTIIPIVQRRTEVPETIYRNGGAGRQNQDVQSPDTLSRKNA